MPGRASPINPPIELKLIIVPPPCFLICGKTSLVRLTIPMKFVSICNLIYSDGDVSIGPPVCIPALFMRTSIRPSFSITVETAFLIESDISQIHFKIIDMYLMFRSFSDSSIYLMTIFCQQSGSLFPKAGRDPCYENYFFHIKSVLLHRGLNFTQQLQRT